MTDIDFAERLNPEQYTAVCHGDGPLLILAGAGSGKTRVITHRIAYLSLVKKVRPGSILAMTFTNKAATEMRERAETLLDEGKPAGETLPSYPWVSTFHRTCSRILRRHAPVIGLRSSFTIYDDGEQKTALRRVMAAMELDTASPMISRASHAIGQFRNKGLDPPMAMQEAVGAEAELYAEIYAGYQKELRRAGCLDFGDLLLQTVRLLRDHPQIRRSYQRQWHYIMVDEFQDTNEVQYELLRLLVGENRNLAVVGDDDQAIYGWRGATVRNILDFKKDYADAVVVKLERNYRSTQVVLDASSSVIRGVSERMEKTLWTDEEGGEPIEVFTGRNGREEASWVVRRLERLIHRERFDSRQCAVFYRKNSQSRLLEEQFRAAGMGYQMVGGTSFYDRAEVKDVLAYLKVALNPSDQVNTLRVINTPSRGIGKKTVERLDALVDGEVIETLFEAVQLAVRAGHFKGVSRVGVITFHDLIQDMRNNLEAGMRPLELTQNLLERLDYLTYLEQNDPNTADDRKENIYQLMAALDEFEADEPGGTLEDFLERISLLQQTDLEAQNMDDAPLVVTPVTMMTVHSSKGLEFDAVFVIGMEEKLFPLTRQNSTDEDMDEERRLCYVALTRARQRLFLSNAQSRRIHAGAEAHQTRPSRFLADIPPDLINIAPESAEKTLLWRDPLPPKRPSSSEFDFDQSVSIEDILHKHPHLQRKASRPKPGYVPEEEEDFGSDIVYDDEYSQVAPDEYRQRQPKAKKRIARKKKEPGDLIGAIAFHKTEGPGEVLSIQGEGDKARLTVRFAKSGREMAVMKRFLKIVH